MQETQDFTLPVSKKQVIIRGYMTGYIDQEIARVMAGTKKQVFDITPEQVKASQESGEDPTPTMHIEFDPNTKIDADNKRIELMVSALDGSTGDVLNRIMQLPRQDVNFVLEKIAEVEGDSRVEGSDPKVPLN